MTYRSIGTPRGVAIRAAALAAALVLTSCAPSSRAAVTTTPEKPSALVLSRPEAARRATALAAIGRRMFVDPSLSASGRMSCASCHSPSHAFGPPNAEPVQRGGASMDQPGVRAVPALRYLQVAPAFIEHYFESEEEGDESVDAGPTGGLNWDGRVDRGRDQVRIPLFSPFEMASHAPSAVVSAVARAPYASDLRALFGDDVFARDDAAMRAIGEAFEAYEQTPEEFYPYTSKYDAVLRGEARLTPQEQSGLELFEDPDKGDCARCHVSQLGLNHELPQFTDYGLVAIGVPRNPAIPANVDPKYYDLGMCGPLRTDLTGRAEYCGRFMTPTLRNAATRQVFFHNGVFHSLRDVVAFYAERDTNPEKWYPREPNGHVKKFDDLPARYQSNVDMDPPFGRRPGDPPALTPQEIDDVVAFIETLTDGYEAAREP
ncbi:MAG TPA: cytochrome c peroxidase [Vicinamibacterales bacterium]|nr:cytochrome c peroxidase [Vicinamibacterales bacterium]